MYFDKDRFIQFLKTDLLGRQLFVYDEIDSTNKKALRLLKEEKASDGMLLISRTQSGGVGRFERKWLSPPGGLWFSIIMFFDSDIRSTDKINLVMANSVVKELKPYIKNELRIKWPNDIYFRDQKIGGILTEILSAGKSSKAIIGVGLNVNNDISSLKDLNIRATTLKNELGRHLCLEKILAGIINYFEKDFNYYLKTEDLDGAIGQIKKILFF